MGKVLIACEYSGIVRDAFIEAGHDAISCDLLPTEGPGPHVRGDVREVLQWSWDLVIAHPPCTYHACSRGAPSDDDDAIFAALDFFIDCQNANAPRVAVENPQIYRFAQAVVSRPDCTVHPYHFGDPWSKRTNFWLRGLPPLLPMMQPGQRFPGWTNWRGGEGHSNPAMRARFHPGMAAAMATQWGCFLAA